MSLHVGPHVNPPSAHKKVNMCNYPIYTDLDHLEMFSRDRTGITNVPEGSLCYFNEGTSLIVYSPILSVPLVVLSGFNA